MQPLNGSHRGGETVVLVHGIWFNGTEMALLRSRLRQAGFEPRQFSYPSLAGTVEQNTDLLARFLESLDGVVHLVGHSLGGLLVRSLLARHLPAWSGGRAVTLGTPHHGSEVARALHGRAGMRWMVGNAFEGGLDGDVPALSAGVELGVIAGSLGLGIGRLLAGCRLESPHDGIVAVSETEVEGMTDRLVLPVSHMGLLLSRRVAEQAGAFLRYGRFRRP